MIHLLVNTNNTRNTMKKTDTFPQSTLLTITDLQCAVVVTFMGL